MYGDIGEVTISQYPDPAGLLIRFAFNVDTTVKKASKRMATPLDVIVERVVTRLYGPSTSYLLRLYDEYESDVLADACAAVADGTVAEYIIAANLGANRRARVQTMGYHTFYCEETGGNDTFGVADVYCIPAAGAR